MARKHPNVLKLQRQKRQGRRRRVAELGGKVYVPRSIGKSGIPEDAQPLFNYRERGKGYYDPYLEAIFPGVKQTSKERQFSLERAEAEKLIAMIEVEDACEWVTLRESPMQKKRTTMVYNRKQDMVFLLEIQYNTDGSGYVKKSKVYGGKDRALFDWTYNRVKWEEHLPLESLDLLLPRS